MFIKYLMHLGGEEVDTGLGLSAKIRAPKIGGDYTRPGYLRYVPVNSSHFN